MQVEDSPYSPGAGHMPIVLVARETQLNRWLAMLTAVESRGRQRAEDTIIVGPRGVGKTVLLQVMSDQARAMGYQVIAMQAARGTGGLMRYLLREIRRRAQAEAPFRSAWQRLQSVSLGAFGVNVAVGRSAEPAPDLADLTAMDLAGGLATLASELRKEHDRGGLLLTIDEMQVAERFDLALLAATLGRLNTDYPDARVIFAGTGLLNVRQTLRDAGVTHPDRLFRLTELPARFTRDETITAIVSPTLSLDAYWDPEAVDAVYQVTGGYPAHVQLYADAVWTAAKGPRVTLAEAIAAIQQTSSEVALSTLDPDWDELTDREREYAAAVAVLGGQARTRDVAQVLDQPPGAVSRTDGGLVRKGFCYHPSRGVVALTMPLQGPFILQVYEESRTTAGVPSLPLGALRERAERTSKLASVQNVAPGSDVASSLDRPPSLNMALELDAEPGRQVAQVTDDHERMDSARHPERSPKGST